MTAAALEQIRPVAYWNNHTIRDAYESAIRRFMEAHSGLLTGRVLDFGAGKPGTCRVPQPYRDLVSGEYLPFDKGDEMPAAPFDAVMANQVLQYLPDPVSQLRSFARDLKPGGHFVATYATNWAEAEQTDLWRITKAGMERALRLIGISVLHHDLMLEIDLNGFKFPLGYGIVGRRPGPRTSLSPDESVKLLTEKILSHEPFYFAKHGDGAIQCIWGYGVETRDKEQYSPQLGAALASSIDALIKGDNVFLGDWMSATFDENREGEYAVEYEELMRGARARFIHFESLLLMRESQVLVEFYKAIATDRRRKLLMGPMAMAGAAKMLGAEHLVIPMEGLFDCVGHLTGDLLSRNFDVLLYGAGMAGHIPVTQCWQKYPERTYINLGSALDVLFLGRTRRQQLPLRRAQQLFRGML